MIEIDLKLEEAQTILQNPEEMGLDDAILAKAVNQARALILQRMRNIEKVDAHPLSWSVYNEYSQLKKKSEGNEEDDKIWDKAEKLAEEKKKKNKKEFMFKRSDKAHKQKPYHSFCQPSRTSTSAPMGGTLLCSRF
jgi:hypothetical protein